MTTTPLPRTFVFVMLTAVLTGCGGNTTLDGPGVQAPGAPPNGFRDAVQTVLPAIVFIETDVTPPPGLDRLLPGLPDEPIPYGMGSGVLITSDGYILTNNHVVQNADRVRVVLQDRRHFEAEVVGLDPSTEIAVVRILGNGFPTAELGDSDRLQLGDWVLALGSPLGLQFSVTAGVISGMGRAIGIVGGIPDPGGVQAAPLEHFIQTDAALSPGNSGGPLINSAGQVIGINTAVVGPAVPGSVGFAIPSNLARLIADQLIHFGEVRRAYLGTVLRDVSPTMAAADGLALVQGAAVMGLEPGGPAQVAGLQEGDIIMHFNGDQVMTVSDLQNRLVRLAPGETVTLRVIRDGRELQADVVLGLVRGGVGRVP